MTNQGADGKGPYRHKHPFVSGVREEDDDMTGCEACAYAAGRASRDVLREALEEIFKSENLSYEQLDMLVACAIAKDDAND